MNAPNEFNVDLIKKAMPVVHSQIQPTPITYSAYLSELVGHEVYVKWDNKLRTGSFKERGAVNVLYSLSGEEKKKGVCAASAGNHALALSYYAQKAGVNCKIIMPTTAPLVKIQSTARTGASVVLYGETFHDAYEKAIEISDQEKRVFVSAFDDYRIMAGQGTIGLEILDQLSDFDSVVVPVGGGGLISGIATAIKAAKPNTFIMGVQSDWIIEQRKIAKDQKKASLFSASIADGIAVKVMGKLTEPVIKKNVDALTSVSEIELADAIVKLLELEKTVVEGAGAAGVAALLAKKLPNNKKKTVVVVCGSNIDINVVSRLITRDMAARERMWKLETSVPDRPGSLHFVTGIIAREAANVLEVSHDRSFSKTPGNVSITFTVEVRDTIHRDRLLDALKREGIGVECIGAAYGIKSGH